MHKDQRDPILITTGILLVITAIVHSLNWQPMPSNWLEFLVDPTAILSAIGACLLLSVGWTRHRLENGSRDVNLTRSANFSYWVGLTAVITLIVFVCIANLMEDGIRDLILLGCVMAWCRCFMPAPTAWWASILTASLLIVIDPQAGQANYLTVALSLLALSRIISVLLELSIQTRVRTPRLPLQ